MGAKKKGEKEGEREELCAIVQGIINCVELCMGLCGISWYCVELCGNRVAVFYGTVRYFICSA